MSGNGENRLPSPHEKKVLFLLLLLEHTTQSGRKKFIVKITQGTVGTNSNSEHIGVNIDIPSLLKKILYRYGLQH